MRVAQINATCSRGSTGKICHGISKLSTDSGIENRVYYVSSNTDYELAVKYATDGEIKLASLASRVFGNWGFNSKSSTQRLIKELEDFSPDVVHLHNIHGHNCHLELLFNYLKEKKTKVVWTFHDCWAFTGYCTHFDMIGCEKWQRQCKDCPQRNDYSWFFDKSERLYKKKKELFSDLDMTIVTPSEWLCDNVKLSFLKDYPVKVINNGIDLSVFNPMKSDFREKYGLEDKYIVLGVAFGWDERKGLDVFVELSRSLPESYQVVLVGTNEKIDKVLPDNIVSIHRTQNQMELAEIYTAADVFVNPTREENYPTVNMEALACGTPVVTFKTGGSAEIIDSTCGISVEKNEIEYLEREVIRICEVSMFTKEVFIEKAKSFDMYKRFQEYIDLYCEVMK